MKKYFISNLVMATTLAFSVFNVTAHAETDVDPTLIHYRTQYEQLLEDYNELQQRYEILELENKRLELQIKCDESNIAMLIEQLNKPQLDLNKDGIVTVSDVVWLMKFISEVE